MWIFSKTKEPKKKIVKAFKKQNEKGGLHVFVAGGSRCGNNPVYEKACYELGVKIGSLGLKLDFGLSGKGIMGAVAKGVLFGSVKKNEVPIQGITTSTYLAFCEKDDLVRQITQVVVAKTLEERKNKLLNADFVLFAPGGIGTLDELVYDCVAMQDGMLSKKPFIIYNVDGFYYHILEFLKQIHLLGFANPVPFIVVDDSLEVGVALEMLTEYFSKKRKNVQKIVEDMIFELPFFVKKYKQGMSVSEIFCLKKLPECQEDIKKAYLEKETGRMYLRLEHNASDTGVISQKLKDLKKGKI